MAEHAVATALLSLLRCALTEQCPPALSAEDWRVALTEARRQRVEGLLYAAATLAEPDSRPPRDVVLVLYAYARRVEEVNVEMGRQVAELFAVYDGLGAAPLLLKGHAVAALYAHPEWRTSGDIDVYVPCNFDRVDRWARVHGKDASPYDPRVTKHIEFRWRGFSVENHFRLSQFYHRRLNRRLQAACAEGLRREAPAWLEVGGRQVATLPPTVGLLHLLVHFANHLVSEGVGLRQLCDIVMYVRRRRDEIDADWLDGQIRALRLTLLTDAVTTLAVDRLGLAVTEVPYRWRRDERRAVVLLDLVMESGNYGQGFAVRRWERRFPRLRKLRLLCRRSRRVARFVPAELWAAWVGKTANLCRFGWRALRWRKQVLRQSRLS